MVEHIAFSKEERDRNDIHPWDSPFTGTLVYLYCSRAKQVTLYGDSNDTEKSRDHLIYRTKCGCGGDLYKVQLASPIFVDMDFTVDGDSICTHSSVCLPKESREKNYRILKRRILRLINPNNELITYLEEV